MQKSNDSTDENLIEKSVLNSEKKIKHTLQDNPLSKNIDRCVNFIGEVFCWLWFVLLIVIIVNVALRYVFSKGMIELEELQWYLFAAAWLAGLSYTFISDGHVRVDVLHEGFQFKTQMWVELIGLLVLFMPFVCFIIYFSIPFVELSWVTNERSQSANGLGARWLIKGCLLFSFILLFLVGSARLLRVVSSLKHGSVQSTKGA
jgi:TRAP-type mannitol/chloroaromatic compound transport system permease small subunit